MSAHRPQADCASSTGDVHRIAYALSKQLCSAHTLSSNYGDLELDDELRTAVVAALRPILEKRLADCVASAGPREGS
jgi:hypothetical protein